MERSPLPRVAWRIVAATLVVLSGTFTGALAQGLPHETGVSWDFETGDLRGWEVVGFAFGGQPTTVGGPSLPPGQDGQQGNFLATSFGRVRGREAAATGQLISAQFTVPRGRLSFLVGGSRSDGVQVQFQVYDSIEQQWVGRLSQIGPGSNRMRRVAWDLEPFAESRGRIAVWDNDQSGYITVDDFRFTVAVRNVVGRLVVQARETLAKQGLGLRELEAVPSDAAAGTVIEQSPEAGAQATLGSLVDVVVAAPVEQPVVVEVPRFVGMQVRDARLRGRETRLRVEVRERLPSPRPENEVLDQDPPPGALVPMGSVVAVTTAAAWIAVPDLLGLPVTEAESRVPQGLVLIVGGRRASDAPVDTVIGQSPRPAERVPAGTQVVVTLAGRARPDRRPPPTPLAPPPTTPDWRWLIPIVVLGAGATALGVRAWRRRASKRRKEEAETLAPRVRPVVDPGQPVVEAGGPEPPRISVRVVRDAGSPAASTASGASLVKEQP